MTFVHNHAQGIRAYDFLVTVTASIRLLYVLVIMEVGTRRIAHFNVTGHPTADRTPQQFREVITGDNAQRFLLHNRDSIYDNGRAAFQPSSRNSRALRRDSSTVILRVKEFLVVSEL
jgi:hypothetical protein